MFLSLVFLVVGEIECLLISGHLFSVGKFGKEDKMWLLFLEMSGDYIYEEDAPWILWDFLLRRVKIQFTPFITCESH